MPRVIAASEEHVIIAMNEVHVVRQIRRRLRPVNDQSYLQESNNRSVSQIRHHTHVAHSAVGHSRTPTLTVFSWNRLKTNL